MPNDYYPQSVTLEDLQRLYRMSYEHRDKLHAMNTDSGKKAAQQSQKSGGPSNTTILGLAVKATTPSDGDTIRFRKKSGQWEPGA